MEELNMKRLEAAQRAIHFKQPPYIPIVRLEDFHKADVVKIPVETHYGGENGMTSEWGFEWLKLDSGLAFGQVKKTPVPEWDQLSLWKPEPITADKHRFDLADKLMKEYPDRYYLADFVLSGFTIMSFVRGFENLLTDFYLEEEYVEELADMVFQREEDLIRECAKRGFHGICFMDDMGTQKNLIFSKKIFRQYFKPRFKKQFDLAHSLGMDVYMHSCGYIYDLIPEYIDIGLDIMNVAQPSHNGIERMAREFGNDVCFSLPVDYQTTAVSGTLEDVENELLQYIDCFAKKDGGFLALVLKGYGSVFGEEKEKKIIEIYDKHCGRKSD